MSREDRQEVERRRQTLEALRAKGLISQDAYRATSAAVEADGSQVACGNCGAFSPSEATICFNCGTAFGPATVLAPETRARLFSTTAAKGLALFVAAVGLITGVLGMAAGMRFAPYGGEEAIPYVLVMIGGFLIAVTGFVLLAYEQRKARH